MAEIRDMEAFVAELDLFTRERIESTSTSLQWPAQNSELDRIIEALIDAPSLDRDQLEQARLHAADRRKLIEQLHFLSAGELAQLIPEHLKSVADNVSEALRQLVDTHQLIRVLIRGEWQYPALQIDTASGALYQSLQSFIKGARNQGYIDWEILSWLQRPYCLPDNTPGQDPLPCNKDASLQEIVDAIKTRHQQRPAAEKPVSPIDLLRAGNFVTFGIHATRWLGS